MIALLLAWQETYASVTPAPILDIHFNLGRLPPPSSKPGDIVITGRRQLPPLLPVLPVLDDDLFPKAKTGLFGGTASVETEAKDFGQGVISNRIMLRWKAKF